MMNKLFYILIPVGLIMLLSNKSKAASANNTTMKIKKPIRDYTWRISSPYGDRWHPTDKVYKFHNGIDIPAPIGTKVYAPLAGVVVDAYWHDKGGHSLIIDHPNGIRTGYAHLNKIFVKKGEAITENQVVAEVGNTGVGTGAHLHFTLRINGNLVNPELYLI